MPDAPLIAAAAPAVNGSKKVAVIGPEATPPESNAIPVKIEGTTLQWKCVEIQNFITPWVSLNYNL